MAGWRAFNKVSLDSMQQVLPVKYYDRAELLVDIRPGTNLMKILPSPQKEKK